MRLFIICVIFIFSIHSTISCQPTDGLAYNDQIEYRTEPDDILQEQVALESNLNQSPDTDKNVKEYYVKPVKQQYVKDSNIAEADYALNKPVANTAPDYDLASPPAGYFIFLIVTSLLAIILLLWKLKIE